MRNKKIDKVIKATRSILENLGDSDFASVCGTHAIEVLREDYGKYIAQDIFVEIYGNMTENEGLYLEETFS